MQFRPQDGWLRCDITVLTAKLISHRRDWSGEARRTAFRRGDQSVSLSCAGGEESREAGRLEVCPAPPPPPRPTVPDVLLSPCPITLDNCMPHRRLRPCPLDIKVQSLAGRWALRSFELVVDTAVTRASPRTAHRRKHFFYTDLPS